MKLPFSIDNYYTTHLSKIQIEEELRALPTLKTFGGFRKDKFISTISENGFTIQCDTYGVDGFTLEQYPLITGLFISDKPSTLNILIKPKYLPVLFFAIFVLTFIPAGIFIDKMTLNGVFRSPTFFERSLFAGSGGGIPGLWCYFRYIRPIGKAKKWIIERLNLTLVNNDGG